MKKFIALFFAGILIASSCFAAEVEVKAEFDDASDFTKRANSEWYTRLDFKDNSERENASRGLIEGNNALEIRDSKGSVVWNAAKYNYMQYVKSQEIPDTVNPSLWRNTVNNSYAGLFKVCDGIYQVRGFDMANMTFIKTDNGWIIFDVMMCTETAEEAIDLMTKHFGELDIKAILYSHSHVDHYGGIEGVINKDDAADANLPLSEQLKSGKVVIIAPEGFLEHAVSENIYAGIAMKRRAEYQYGVRLKAGNKGAMSIGIGLGQATGTVGLLAPTYVVKSNEKIIIDGLEVEIQLTPGTEAPAEMNAYFPKYNALWLAENCTGTLHNIYTLRGAEVRDSAAWSKYIVEALQLFGDKTDVVFQSHNWPHWGNDNVKTYMANTAAIYKFIYDQTLFYINKGYTSTEIAELIKLPDELDKIWYTRQYYGTLIHNSKAVYQKYMGWYDANPVNLNLLTPEKSAKKLIEYLGDVDEVLKKARRDYDNGEYQWVAQITKEIIFADPSNKAARELCAKALEQLAYQSESGTWRNAYLTASLELREGTVHTGRYGSNIANMMQDMTMSMILDYVAIRNDDFAAQNADVKINLVITDTDESFFVERRHGVILVFNDETRDNADLSVTCTKMQFIALLAGQSPEVKQEGNITALRKLFAFCENFTPDFNVIEP
ncbi:MAG: MBL fold metallo-hydrolase [Synergistaceae bacterium]|nr:MBL fold metallo-hydrolase [Synergistaceae bacterium]